MEITYVLWWQYPDKSGTGLVRCYTDKTRADEDYELIKEDMTKEWNLTEVPTI